MATWLLITSVFMIYNGSEFAVFRLYKNRTIIDTTNQNAHFRPSTG